MDCRPTGEYTGARFVCENDKDLDAGVFLNVLAEGMPECDRKEHSVTLDELKEFEEPPKCYVYCAQRTCTAAKKFMEEHSEELGKLCDTVSYLPGGALEMNPDDLVDGKACHAKIIEHNMKQGIQDGCLTCGDGEEDQIKLEMTMDGDPVDATYYETKDVIPDWYKRAGIVGTLPTQFSCDKRYKTPVVHDNGGVQVEMNIEKTGLPKNALIAYWGANPSTDVRVAPDAYDEFQNSGIAQCKEYQCKFKMNIPARYTADGKVYKKHLHVTDWDGFSWNLKAKTIDIE